MSRGQTLRALVNERLAAAAEDIFVLFERTIVEYEEELCRSKEENQRRLQVLSTNPGPGLNQEITETPWIKEEPKEQNVKSVKKEENQPPMPVPGSSAVCMKTEESLLQQRQTEETQGEDISSETHFHSETEGHTETSAYTDNDVHWEPFSWSAPQMDTEAEGDNYNHIQIRDRSTELFPQNRPAPETSVHSGHMSGAHGGAEEKKFQCFFCNKKFGTKQVLQRHIRVHTGEKPYSCTVCEKTFTLKHHLDVHVRTHTGEKPYRCSLCEKGFAQKASLEHHRKTHTGEKPFSCSVCEKTFPRKDNLLVHMRTHTGDKPFSCTICHKAFSQKFKLKSHMSLHKGDIS